jgi:hypothetical protein
MSNGDGCGVYMFEVRVDIGARDATSGYTSGVPSVPRLLSRKLKTTALGVLYKHLWTMSDSARFLV